MSKLVVDRRSRLISRGTQGQDDVVDMVLAGEVAPDILEAVDEIKKDKVQRLYIEASLLTSAPLPEISEYFEIPTYVLEMYATLNYDVRDLTRLQRISVLAKEKDEDSRQLKAWAIAQGFGFIKWRTGGSSRIPPVDGLVSLFSDSYYKSKEAFYNSNETVASKEASKWVKQATDLARLLKMWTTDSEEARQDIELALKKVTGDDIKFASLEDIGIDSLDKQDEES